MLLKRAMWDRYVAGDQKANSQIPCHYTAYCVNIFVCWCCVGSDRVAGVGVSLGTLGLVRYCNYCNLNL